MPCVRKAMIIADLPSSIQYWKSRFFFMFGDEWETPSDEFWGEVPRLLCCWRALSLGAPSFRKSFSLGLLLTSLFVASVQLRSVQSSRAGTRSASMLPLSTLSRLTTSMIWSILELWLVTALVQSLPPSTCMLLRLKKKLSVCLVCPNSFSFFF